MTVRRAGGWNEFFFYVGTSCPPHWLDICPEKISHWLFRWRRGGRGVQWKESCSRSISLKAWMVLPWLNSNGPTFFRFLFLRLCPLRQVRWPPCGVDIHRRGVVYRPSLSGRQVFLSSPFGWRMCSCSCNCYSCHWCSFTSQASSTVASASLAV